MKCASKTQGITAENVLLLAHQGSLAKLFACPLCCFTTLIPPDGLNARRGSSGSSIDSWALGRHREGGQCWCRQCRCAILALPAALFLSPSVIPASCKHLKSFLEVVLYSFYSPKNQIWGSVILHQNCVYWALRKLLPHISIWKKGKRSANDNWIFGWRKICSLDWCSARVNQPGWLHWAPPPFCCQIIWLSALMGAYIYCKVKIKDFLWTTVTQYFFHWENSEIGRKQPYQIRSEVVG